MKMFFIIYSTDIDRQVLITLKQSGCKNYTQFENIVGVGDSGAKLGTAIGPGTNKVVMILVEDAQVKDLCVRLENLKKSFLRKQGLKVIVLPVEQII
ncbi:MAG TPA: hypothetical protein DCS63_02455 [Elusimicrobia bacterium]|nr:hypothetical protein [Elusimicrobiota bacterium]